MEHKTLTVAGMTCHHCVNAVSGALSGIAGVADVAVSLQNGAVSFNYDPALDPLEAVRAAIIDEGYAVTG